MSKVKFVHVSGICVIIASLFLSGCAHQTGVQAMRTVDLDYFQVRCDIKQEQIKFLQSQRVTRDQQLFARISNVLMPWRSVTAPDSHVQNYFVGQGQTNWLINQHLLKLSRDCP